jgi:predicted RNA-binding Zn ribbon-like protein
MIEEMGDSAFLWIGNHPATDLCNTEPVIDGRTVELLPDLESVVEWARLAGVETGVAASDVTGTERKRTVDFVRRLRGALRAVLEAEASDPRPMRALNETLAGERGALHVDVAASEPVALAASGAGAQLRLDIASAVLDIFHHDRDLVRRCANPACVLLFLDISKSGRRRWCDMAVCGNRAKAAAHYARTAGHAGRG